MPCACAGCADLRNRSLELLARSNLKLQELVVGRNAMLPHNKPRITNLVRPLSCLQA